MNWLLPLLLLMEGSCCFEVWVDCRRSALPRLPPHLAHSNLFDRQLIGAATARRAAAAPSPLETLAVDASSGRIHRGETLVGASFSVDTPSWQQRALATVGSVEWVHIDCAAQPMIIAENFLSRTESTPTRVAIGVNSAAEVPGLAFALERGVDALVCAAEALEGCEDDRTPAAALLEAIAIAKAQRLESAEKALGAGGGSGGGDVALTLRPARVVEVADGGVADRVAIDFTRLLHKEEGVLVGSAAKALAFVYGETVE